VLIKNILCFCTVVFAPDQFDFSISAISPPPPDGWRLAQQASEHGRECRRAVVTEIQGNARHRFTGDQPRKCQHHTGALPPLAETQPGLLAKQAIEGAQTDVQLIGPLLRRLVGVGPLHKAWHNASSAHQAAAEYAAAVVLSASSCSSKRSERRRDCFRRAPAESHRFHQNRINGDTLMTRQRWPKSTALGSMYTLRVLTPSIKTSCATPPESTPRCGGTTNCHRAWSPSPPVAPYNNCATVCMTGQTIVGSIIRTDGNDRTWRGVQPINEILRIQAATVGVNANIIG
jgi:hypothetical protein